MILRIITEIQALAQSGLAYCKSDFDRERYNRLLVISSELASLRSDFDQQKIFELFSKEEGYATPKIDVRGAVFKDNKILLVKEKSDDLWSLPGGWADVNYSPAENTIKELREETGYEGKVIKLIGIYDQNKRNPTTHWPHVYKLLFLCEIVSGPHTAPSASEIEEIKFFDLNTLPGLSTHRINKQQIDNCFRHLTNPMLPTDFD